MRQLGIENYSQFSFTRKWFLNRNLPTFRKFVYPRWAAIPCLYLEIGVFEGQSAVWMLQRVLTHPNSRAVLIDPWLMTTKLSADFMQSVMERALFNTRHWDNCRLLRANSAEALRRMTRRGGFLGVEKNSVDVCMIDGNHNALAVMDDARLCLQLVKPGGWLMFDDVENDRRKKDHVRDGLRVFLEESKSQVSLVVKHRYMEIYEKR